MKRSAGDGCRGHDAEAKKPNPKGSCGAIPLTGRARKGTASWTVSGSAAARGWGTAGGGGMLQGAFGDVLRNIRIEGRRAAVRRCQLATRESGKRSLPCAQTRRAFRRALCRERPVRATHGLRRAPQRPQRASRPHPERGDTRAASRIRLFFTGSPLRPHSRVSINGGGRESTLSAL